MKNWLSKADFSLQPEEQLTDCYEPSSGIHNWGKILKDKNTDSNLYGEYLKNNFSRPEIWKLVSY